MKQGSSYKKYTANPLKSSQPVGSALAFMGIKNSMPLLHGSQGCTAFGIVMYVRHFREPIPLQTTAMNEVTTILGGSDSLVTAIGNIHKKTNPSLIGISSTGLTETKGDDLEGDLKNFRAENPEFENIEVVYVSTPDFTGSLQTGWSKSVESIIKQVVRDKTDTVRGKINVLAGCHLTGADLEEIRETIESFGLSPVILPDISGSLSGNMYEEFSPTTSGGTDVQDIRKMNEAEHTIVVGEHMREAAEILAKKSGIPYTLFRHLSDLDSIDRFLKLLSDISGKPVINKYRRHRAWLQDAMLDTHFYFSGKKIAIAGEPELLRQYSDIVKSIGGTVITAVSTIDSPLLKEIDCQKLIIGDLEDLEENATGCDLLITHAHGRQISDRLGIPLYRAGIPVFDRLGVTHKQQVGYRGLKEVLFDIGNIFIENHEPEVKHESSIRD